MMCNEDFFYLYLIYEARMDLLEIGGLVKTNRKARGWSQAALAEKSGVSRARIEALENARIAEIGFKHLLRIMNSLGLDLRVTQLNRGRPTLEDLMAEEAKDNAPRLDR
jgi:transcriptional regulator with XRE-family HTH domain